MTTKTQDANRNGFSGVVHTAERGTKPVQAFVTKFNNDWSMNLSAALAYNLMMAVFPLVIALFSILGLILGNLNPSAYDQLRGQIIHVFPTATSASNLLDAAFTQLKRNAGVLGIIAIILALFFSLGGILGGLIAAYILFQAIYIVVPNQKISFHHSWLGAVVATILLQAYLILFPLYVTRFLTGYAGQTLGLVILLVFFYYFAVILILGAEVNAFFAEGVKATPHDLVTMVHEMTSHLPTSEQEVKQEAAATHKNIPPKEMMPKNERTGKAVTHVDNAPTSAETVVHTMEQPQDKSMKARLTSLLLSLARAAALPDGEGRR